MATRSSPQPSCPPNAGAALALGAGLVTVTRWASAFVGIRSASHHLSPGALAFGRLSIASLALGLILISRREPLIDRAISGRSRSSACSGSGSTTSRSTRPSAASTPKGKMLVNIRPILIAVLAGFVFHGAFRGGCSPDWPLPYAAGSGGHCERDLPTGPRGELGRAAVCVRGDGLLRGGHRRPETRPGTRVDAAGDLRRCRCTFGAVVCLPFAFSLGDQLSDADRVVDRLDGLSRRSPRWRSAS